MTVTSNKVKFRISSVIHVGKNTTPLKNLPVLKNPIYLLRRLWLWEICLYLLVITTAWLVNSYFILRSRDWMVKFYDKKEKWKEHRNRETASNVSLFLWEGKVRSCTKLWSKEGKKEQNV